MKKELKDYLHLYLGCKIVLNEDMIWLLSGVHSHYIVLDGGAYGVIKITDFSTVKPILRPLSDMTEEEKRECVEVVYDYSVKWSDTQSWVNQFNKLVFPVNNDFIHKGLLLHLLSKHFDVFGLIESGLALDATLIQNTGTSPTK